MQRALNVMPRHALFKKKKITRKEQRKQGKGYCKEY